MNPIIGYSDRVREAGIDLIGLIAWYSVSNNVEVKWDEFESLVSKYSAPMRCPARPKPGDVFKRAASKAQLLRQPTDVPGEYINYNVRTTSSDDHSVHRAIVGERVDSKSRVLDYETLADLTFNKTTEDLDVDFCPVSGSYPQLDEIVDRLVDYVDTHKELLSPVQLRILIGDTFTGALNGFVIRDGGTVYFVDRDNSYDLEACAAVASEIEGMSIGLAPCINDEIQRDTVASAYQNVAAENAEDLLNKVSELRDIQKASGSVPANKFATITSMFNDQKENTDKIQKELSTTMTEVSLTMAMVEGTINEILLNELS